MQTRFHVVQYRAGRFDGIVSGMGRHRGTLDSDHSRRQAQRHAADLRREPWRARAGLSYRVEPTT